MAQLICGKNSVLDAIKNQLPLQKIYVLKPLDIKVANNLKVIVTTKDFLDKMTNQNHQGYIAQIKQFEYYNLEVIWQDQPLKVLILDHLQDPHNFGSIMRSANGLGVKHIIIPKDRAVDVNETVLKVASGGQIGLKIIRVSSLLDAVVKLKKHQFWIYATSLEKNAIDINQADSFNTPTAVIMGNEGSGISKTLIKQADVILKIPLYGSVESLNVAVATAIVLSKL